MATTEITSDPINNVTTTTTTTSTTSTAPTPPASSSPPSNVDSEAAHRVTKLENQRKMCYTVGCVQLAWGIIGMFIAFSWVSNILTLATGALSVGAWSNLNNTLKFFDRNQPNCCNPTHTKPLCISIIVFTILELISFGAVFPIGVFFIAIANVSATGADGSTYTVPAGPRAYITYIGLSIVLGAIWPIISLILSIIQMCFTDSLMSIGASRVYVNPSSAQITVINMQPVMQQPMMQPGAYPVAGPNGVYATPNIYQMAQQASAVPVPGSHPYMQHYPSQYNMMMGQPQAPPPGINNYQGPPQVYPQQPPYPMDPQAMNTANPYQKTL